MKKFFSRAAVALLASSTLAGVAVAEGEWSGNIAIGTDYVWRGVTQTNGDLAVSGGFDYTNDIFYAGTWASNVDFGDTSDTNVELDLYGGIASEFANGVSWDVGVIGYLYPDADDEDLDFVEVYGGLGYSIEGGPDIGGYVYFDPDNESIYAEATAGYGFTDVFAVDASIGQYSFDEGDDYTNFSVGATYSLEGFDLDLRYWSNDIDDGGDPATEDLLDDRVVFTVSRSL